MHLREVLRACSIQRPVAKGTEPAGTTICDAVLSGKYPSCGTASMHGKGKALGFVYGADKKQREQKL